MVNLSAEEVLRALIRVFTISIVLSLESVRASPTVPSLFLFLSLKSNAQSPRISPIPPNR